MKQILHGLLASILLLIIQLTTYGQQGIPKQTLEFNDTYRGWRTFFISTFPPGGTISGRLWGTNLYTDDGSIATAAVHAGYITAADGGTVTIEIKPGAASYQGSVQHGVTSKDYGTFSGSFIIISGKKNAPGSNVIQAD
ncbi:MAG: hypothetical protein IPN43_06225 [Chitinophagaceae bacterium]|nr:hypothetical protein [Chitinophagaceae bacterium]